MFAMASNWASFAGDVLHLEGCEMEIHLPVKNPAHCVFYKMVPFATKPGKVVLLCWVVSADEKALRQGLPVGSTVNPDLFP